MKEAIENERGGRFGKGHYAKASQDQGQKSVCITEIELRINKTK
ncbi:hypothetical protein FHX15_003407 [Rhizobium sp. BK650]|nr:hypothetical protein [Rhizobium sp. BK650]MBB3658165.1 hypothetical protein [Rhizobium sp. BK650]